MVAGGVVLILSNFLFFDALRIQLLIPIGFIIAGIILLFRGDVHYANAVKPFSLMNQRARHADITLSSTLSDIAIQPFGSDSFINIRGTLPADAVPSYRLTNDVTRFVMTSQRSTLLDTSTWQVEMNTALLWTISATSWLGQIHIDLDNLSLGQSIISTGIGDIELTTPSRTEVPLIVSSGAGTVIVHARVGVPTHITVRNGSRARIEQKYSYYNRRETDTADREYTVGYVAGDDGGISPSVELVISVHLGQLILA